MDHTQLLTSPETAAPRGTTTILLSHKGEELESSEDDALTLGQFSGSEATGASHGDDHPTSHQVSSEGGEAKPSNGEALRPSSQLRSSQAIADQCQSSVNRSASTLPSTFRHAARIIPLGAAMHRKPPAEATNQIAGSRGSSEGAMRAVTSVWPPNNQAKQFSANQRRSEFAGSNSSSRLSSEKLDRSSARAKSPAASSFREDEEAPPPEQSKFRRNWSLPRQPIGTQRRTYCRDLTIYYLKSPSQFFLMLVILENEPKRPQSLVSDSGSKDHRSTLEDGKAGAGDSAPSGDSRQEVKPCREPTVESSSSEGVSCSPAPGIETYAPVFTHSVVSSLQSAMRPDDLLIGRNISLLDGVPHKARRWISRRHCAIQSSCTYPAQYGEVYFLLRDLRSTNRTYLNGLPMPKGSIIPLQNGDIIGLSMGEPGCYMVGLRFMLSLVAQRTAYCPKVNLPSH